jgi:hypothetical protein
MDFWTARVKGVDFHAPVLVPRRDLDWLSTAVLQIVVVIAVNEGRPQSCTRLSIFPGTLAERQQVNQVRAL